MNRSLFNVLMVMACLLAAVSLCAGSEFWAQTTFVRGDVSVVSSSSSDSETLKIGDVLHRGDRVTAGDEGRASFLLNDGSILTLSSGKQITLGEDSSSTNPTLAQVASNLTKTLLAREGDNPMLKHLGGLRAEGKNIALAPCETKVRKDTLTFAWIPKPLTKRYTFTLMGPDDMFLEETVRVTSIRIPSEKISSDTTYYWEVRDAAIRNSITSLGSGSFTTLDPATERKLQSLEKNIDDAFTGQAHENDLTPYFLRYQIYREMGLNLDALKILQEMINRDPDNSNLQRWKSELAEIMGLDEGDLTLLSSL